MIDEISKAGMSRRGFLGGAAASLGVSVLAAATAFADTKDTVRSDGKAILFDGAKCVGCRYCELGCKRVNGLSSSVDVAAAKLGGATIPKEMIPDAARIAAQKQDPVLEDDRDGNRYLRVVEIPSEDGLSRYMRHSCMHCGLCSSVCPSGALTRAERGTVTVDKDRCIGCKYCYQSCPFDIPRFSEEAADKTIRKCTGCNDRVAEGKAPGCVEFCPTGALQHGDTADMIIEGRRHVESLRKEGFADAQLYGENQLGEQMHVLYVLPGTPASSGLPKIR